MVNLQKQIMRRVYLIWAFRKVFNMFTLKLAAIFVLTWQLSVQVFFAKVIQNSPLAYGDVLGSIAFFNAGLVVVGAFLSRDLARNLIGMRKRVALGHAVA
jgi:hypothetical protein